MEFLRLLPLPSRPPGWRKAGREGEVCLWLPLGFSGDLLTGLHTLSIITQTIMMVLVLHKWPQILRFRHVFCSFFLHNLRLSECDVLILDECDFASGKFCNALVKIRKTISICQKQALKETSVPILKRWWRR